MKRILFADNDATLLKIRSSALDEAGYEVLSASSPQQAEQLLEEHDVHLIIIDIRLFRDRDPHDISGLLLAKDQRYRAVPKIVLTKYPTYEAVREALGADVEGMAPPAVNFVAKQEGVEAMLQAVRDVFDKHVRVNWEMAIEFDERHPLSFPHLVTTVAPGLEARRLADCAGELENLFRRLFFSHQRIRIDRLLWQRDGRFAAVVWAFADGRKPEGRIVVGGDHARTADERASYQKFAPSAPGQNSTVWVAKDETLHFGANVYALADADLSHVTSLAEAYRLLPEKAFHAALRSLFEQTLAKWHQGPAVVRRDECDDDYYQRLSGMGPERVPLDAFEDGLRHLLSQCLTLGVEARLDAAHLQVRLGRQLFTYPNPALELYAKEDDPLPAVLNHVPGALSGGNVLTYAEGRTWLTDFADAGLAPLLWNFAEVEAAIRFDWAEAEQVAELQEMERCLVRDNFNQWDASDVANPLRKPLRAIQVIRRLAAPYVDDPRAYYRAMLFLAAGRLVGFNHAVATGSDLVRLTHLLLACAMIGESLGRREYHVADFVSHHPGIYIDKANRVVLRDGVRLLVRGQSYELLIGLYDNSGRLCTHKQIVEDFLGERVFDGDESQINRLNTAVRRLREKIEYDPNHPRFLLTDAGGYRLMPRPDN